MTDQTSDDLRVLLRSLLEEHRTDATSLSRQIGRSKDYIRDYLEGRKNFIPIESLWKIEEAFSLPSGSLVDAKFRDSVSQRIKSNPLDQEEGKTSQINIELSKDWPRYEMKSERIPIFSFADQLDGTMITNKNVVYTIPRPYLLANAPNSYGIIVEGEVMSPAYDPGDIALVNPDISLRMNADAILFRPLDPDGSSGERRHRCVLRRLQGYDDQHWRVMELSPCRETTLLRSEWPDVSRVVGKFARP